VLNSGACIGQIWHFGREPILVVVAASQIGRSFRKVFGTERTSVQRGAAGRTEEKVRIVTGGYVTVAPQTSAFGYVPETSRDIRRKQQIAYTGRSQGGPLCRFLMNPRRTAPKRNC
jgi:hypothetical protein